MLTTLNYNKFISDIIQLKQKIRDILVYLERIFTFIAQKHESLGQDLYIISKNITNISLINYKLDIFIQENINISSNFIKIPSNFIKIYLDINKHYYTWYTLIKELNGNINPSFSQKIKDILTIYKSILKPKNYILEI